MSDPIFSPLKGIFDDPAMLTAQSALDGLALRQDVIGRNLANVDTPGYKAQAVNFENALRRAEAGLNTITLATTNAAHLDGLKSDPANLSLATLRQGGSARADGNNVDVDEELSRMAETGIRFQAITQLVSKKLLLLKSIATGR